MRIPQSINKDSASLIMFKVICLKNKYNVMDRRGIMSSPIFCALPLREENKIENICNNF